MLGRRAIGLRLRLGVAGIANINVGLGWADLTPGPGFKTAGFGGFFPNALPKLTFTWSDAGYLSSELDSIQSGFVSTGDARIGNSDVQLSATQLRNTPGIVTINSELAPVSGRWLNASVPTPIPSQVGDALAGRSFNTFGDLRQAIWEQIGTNPELSSGFSRANLAKMGDGLAPSAPSGYWADSGAFGTSFNIHHFYPIENGGAVYDLSNLQLASPKVHFDLHYGPN